MLVCGSSTALSIDQTSEAMLMYGMRARRTSPNNELTLAMGGRVYLDKLSMTHSNEFDQADRRRSPGSPPTVNLMPRRVLMMCCFGASVATTAARGAQAEHKAVVARSLALGSSRLGTALQRLRQRPPRRQLSSSQTATAGITSRTKEEGKLKSGNPL